MKKLFVLSLMMVSSITTYSSSYVICGQKANFYDFEVSGYVLELSSESDNYQGYVGGSWHLKLKSQESNWVLPNKNIKARTLQEGDSTVVEIKVASGRSSTGAVGVRYKLIGPYDEEPVLEEYTMGGFAGSVKIATFECLSGND